MHVSLIIFLTLSSAATIICILTWCKKRKIPSHKRKGDFPPQQHEQAVIQSSPRHSAFKVAKEAPKRKEELSLEYLQSEKFEPIEYPHHHPCPWYEKLITFIKLAMYDEAIDMLNTAIEEGAQLESNAAIASLTICNKAIRLNPFCAEIWYIKGLIHIQLRRYEDALYPLKRAVELRLDYIDDLYYRATTSLLSYEDKRHLKYICQELYRERLYKTIVKYSKALDTFWDDAYLKDIARDYLAGLAQPMEPPL